MSTNPRDTQFRGSAKLLIEAIDKVTDDFCKEPFDKGIKALARDICASDAYEEKVQTLVAQWAHDLACHIVDHVSESQAAMREVENLTAAEIVQDIPDMAEWPRKDQNDTKV